MGACQTQRRPEHPEKRRRPQRQPEGLPNPIALAGAKIGGNDRLRRLPDAVGTALHKGADLDDGAIDRQRIRSHIAHNLPVKQHRQNPHRHINKKGRKAGNGNFPELGGQPPGIHQPERVLAAEKMGQHHGKGHAGADGGRKPRSENTHIAGKHKEIIAKHIEDAAGQHLQRRLSGVAVVAQKRRQHLIKQKQGKYPFNRTHIALRQPQQGVVRAEKGQNRLP